MTPLAGRSIPAHLGLRRECFIVVLCNVGSAGLVARTLLVVLSVRGEGAGGMKGGGANILNKRRRLENAMRNRHQAIVTEHFNIFIGANGRALN